MGEERYQALKQVGRGMMSVVWLARDTSTQQLVALKIMLTIAQNDRLNNKAQERFLREIEITRNLRHPHILPIIDDGYTRYENRTVPFLVCPYIEEGSLAELIEQRPPWEHWSLPQTADAILQAAESLYYLHTRTPQIVHQDVKPGNFLYRSQQTVQRAVYLYLCDFGISRQQQPDALLSSEVLGTFAYMAPEQIERKVNCASDQYALAVMACYLLTGKLPLHAESNDHYIHAHLYDAPIPPSQLKPQRLLSPEIDAAIIRALEKRPEQRFATIVEFAQALQQAIMQQTQGQIIERSERLHAMTTQTAQSTQPVARRVLPAAPLRFEPPISIVLDPPDVDKQHVLDEPLPSRPKATLSLHNVALELAPLRWHMSARIQLPVRPKMLCWSYNGERLAMSCYGHVPLILEKDGSLQAVQTLNAEHATCVCWSPDGRVLAVSAQGEIRFWDTREHVAFPLVLSFTIHTIDGLNWSSRGKLALWVRDRVLIYAVSYTLLREINAPLPSQSLSTDTMRCGNVGALRWSPDGSQLVAGASNGSILCWRTESPCSLWQVATAPGQKVNSLAWSPDGSLLVAAFRDCRLHGWNTQTKQRVLVWEKIAVMPRMISIARSGRIVIASSEKRLLIGFPHEASPSGVLAGQLLACWSPVHRELATLDEQQETVLVLWDE